MISVPPDHLCVSFLFDTSRMYQPGQVFSNAGVNNLIKDCFVVKN